MNYEKLRTQLWTSVYMSTEGSAETKATQANKAVDSFDERFDMDEDFNVSVDDIIDVLKKSKLN